MGGAAFFCAFLLLAAGAARASERRRDGAKLRAKAQGTAPLEPPGRSGERPAHRPGERVVVMQSPHRKPLPSLLISESLVFCWALSLALYKSLEHVPAWTASALALALAGAVFKHSGAGELYCSTKRLATRIPQLLTKVKLEGRPSLDGRKPDKKRTPCAFFTAFLAWLLLLPSEARRFAGPARRELACRQEVWLSLLRLGSS